MGHHFEPVCNYTCCTGQARARCSQTNFAPGILGIVICLSTIMRFFPLCLVALMAPLCLLCVRSWSIIHNILVFYLLFSMGKLYNTVAECSRLCRSTVLLQLCTWASMWIMHNLPIKKKGTSCHYPTINYLRDSWDWQFNLTSMRPFVW